MAAVAGNYPTPRGVGVAVTADGAAASACGGIGIGKGKAGTGCQIVTVVYVQRRIRYGCTIEGCTCMAGVTGKVMRNVAVGLGSIVGIVGREAVAAFATIAAECASPHGGGGIGIDAAVLAGAVAVDSVADRYGAGAGTAGCSRVVLFEAGRGSVIKLYLHGSVGMFGGINCVAVPAVVTIGRFNRINGVTAID